MALGTGVHNLSLVVRATNRTRRVFQQVGRDLTLLDRTRQTVGKGFGQLGTAGVVGLKALAAGTAVALGGSILAYSQFDAAMTQSLAIAEDVGPKMRKQLEDAARGIAKVTTFSAKEAASAYFNLISSGQTLAQAMESLPVVAKFAQAGMFDLEIATELLVTSQNALGLSFEDPIKNMQQMKRVADVLAKADESAVGSIEDFADALTNRAAAAMRTYGIEVEEGVAVLAAWATQGLKGKTAGEAFAIVTRDLQKAALKEKDAWREVNAAVFDNQGNMRNLADIVGDLESAMEGLTDAQKKQLLSDLGFQERSQQRLLQLLGTSEAIRQFEKDFKKAGGTVERIANKQLQTATQQLKLLWNAIVDIFIGAGSEFDKGFVDAIARVKEFVIAIGPDVQAAVRRFVELLGKVGDFMSTLAGHLRSFSQEGTGFTKWVENLPGPLRIMVEALEEIDKVWTNAPDWAKDALKDWAKLIPVIVLLSGVIKVLGIVLGVLAGPGALVAAAIAALVIGFKTLWERSEEFRSAIQGLVDWFRNTAVPFLEQAWVIIQIAAANFVNWFRNDAVPFLQGAWVFIQEAAANFASWFQTELLPWLQQLWAQIQETFDAAWKFIVALWDTGSNLVMEIWDKFGATIIQVLKNVWDIIAGVVLGAWEILEGIFKLFTSILKGDWSAFWDALKTILSGAWKVIWSILKGIWNNFANLVTTILRLAGVEWEDFWNGLKGAASRAWNGVINWFTGVWETFKNTWDTGWNLLKSLAGAALSGISGIIKGPFNSILALVENVVNFAISGLNKLIGLANKIPGIDLQQIGKIDIPRLATGGKILAQGLAIVGEAGPELLRIPKGAIVEPIPRSGPVPQGYQETIIFQGTPQQMLSDWRRESKLRMAGM